eukprot:999940-Pleurochrysis_carterae.AAC.2
MEDFYSSARRSCPGLPQTGYCNKDGQRKVSNLQRLSKSQHLSNLASMTRAVRAPRIRRRSRWARPRCRRTRRGTCPTRAG